MSWFSYKCDPFIFWFGEGVACPWEQRAMRQREVIEKKKKKLVMVWRVENGFFFSK